MSIPFPNEKRFRFKIIKTLPNFGRVFDFVKGDRWSHQRLFVFCEGRPVGSPTVLIIVLSTILTICGSRFFYGRRFLCGSVFFLVLLLFLLYDAGDDIICRSFSA